MRKLLYILPLFLGFILTGGPPWQQQYMPNINGASVRDIIFTDSLNGYAVTNIGGSNSYILKTSDGGDNWVIKFMHTQPFVRVSFINSNTGFTNAFNKIFKTSNAGENWNVIDLPSIFGDDMFVLSEDTIWLAMSESLTGGVYRTTNGGVNWTQQFSGGNQNPNKIYMYNGQFGFMSNNSALPNIYRTTNSGLNWNVVVNGERFVDMDFIDTLTGWRAGGGLLKKTTDGGLNWVLQPMPSGGYIESNNLSRFSVISEDTLWGCGGYLRYPNNQLRGIVYRTTNSGTSWHYQVPDTSLPIVAQYGFIDFAGSTQGWFYANFPTYVSGLHTTTGGDTNWITGIQQLSTELPIGFQLYQNYPNPFNPTTNLKFKIKNANLVKLSVYDITGRELAILVNERVLPGEYNYTFDGNNLTSGIYFYSLFIDSKIYDTKRMMLIK